MLSLDLLSTTEPAVLFITPPSPWTCNTLPDELEAPANFTTAKYTKDIDPFFPTCILARGRHSHHRVQSRHRVSYSATRTYNTYPTTIMTSARRHRPSLDYANSGLRPRQPRAVTARILAIRACRARYCSGNPAGCPARRLPLSIPASGLCDIYQAATI